MSFWTPTQSAASQAASSAPALVGPSKAVLAEVRTVPSSGRNGRGKRRPKIVGKVFNPQAARPRPTLSSPLKEYNCVMEYSQTQFTTSTSIPTLGSQVFTLNSFADYSSYVALFDEYRINTLEVWLDPAIIISGTTGSAMLHSAVDLDDANTPAGAADVTARQGCLSSDTGSGHYHKWQPYVANALYSGTFTSYGSETAQWIDCASPGVQHYGLKYATQQADGIVRPYYITVRASVTFRGSAI